MTIVNSKTFRTNFSYFINKSVVICILVDRIILSDVHSLSSQVLTDTFVGINKMHSSSLCFKYTYKSEGLHHNYQNPSMCHVVPEHQALYAPCRTVLKP